MVLDLFYISLILVFIIDISGFTNSLRDAISKYYTKKLKINIDPEEVKLPYITCSLCSVWWTGIIYLFVTHNISLYGLSLVGIYSALTSVMANFMQLILDLCNSIISKIYKIIQ